MSACYRLVLDSVCRSNHHRIAVMALEHLQSEDATSWRNLFLKHRDAYLEGAKAPDEVFMIFAITSCMSAMAIGAARLSLRANGIAAPCAPCRRRTGSTPPTAPAS